MCADVERAVTVSLQPIDLVGAEAVILFQDIFTPIPAMGVDLDFAPGPVLADPIREAGQIEKLRVPDPRESVPFVFEILGRLREALASRDIPLLGFAGAPFTLAAYMVQGSGSKDFSILKAMLQKRPDEVDALLEKLTALTIDYLKAQIEAGAEAVQLFDTWAGLLDVEAYDRFVHPYPRADRRPPSRTSPHRSSSTSRTDRACGGSRLRKPGADVISLDWRVRLSDVARAHGQQVSLQGNLDPCWLHASARADLRDGAQDGGGRIGGPGPRAEPGPRLPSGHAGRRRARLHRRGARAGLIKRALDRPPVSAPLDPRAPRSGPRADPARDGLREAGVAVRAGREPERFAAELAPLLA